MWHGNCYLGVALLQIHTPSVRKYKVFCGNEAKDDQKPDQEKFHSTHANAQAHTFRMESSEGMVTMHTI